jgi:hypothetical protein
MKTTIYTMIVLLVFNASMLFAGGIKHYTIKSETNKIEAAIDLEKLAPSTPLFAEFTDGTEYKAGPEVLISNLAPATPKEADFEDASLPVEINMEQLAPISPKDPGFEDIAGDQPGTPVTLAPSTPNEADFTD